MKSNNALSLIIQSLYLVFFTSLAFAFNFLSSLSIGLILIMGIIKNKNERKPLFHSTTKKLFLIACILFYLWQVISFFYTENKQETLAHIRIKSALLFVPLALCISDHLTAITTKKLISLFCIALFTASLYCLVADSLNYFQHQDPSVFFYHALVSPLHQHAVFFSIYVFIALLHLVEAAPKKEFVFNKTFHLFLILFFSVFIFILCSKLVISFYLFYLFYYVIRFFVRQKKKRNTTVILLCSGLLAAVLLVSIPNPVSDRFKEILNTDMNLVKQDRFDPGIYFNDVQFRIIEWKLVAEILNEKHSWWIGVSPGDGQDLLDKKYIEKGMYTGDAVRKDHGYLRYNTHDQLLESLLQSGIAGVLLFLFILFALIRMAWKKRNLLLRFTIILLIAFSLIESVFETQYAIMLFTFFPLFLSIDEKQG